MPGRGGEKSSPVDPLAFPTWMLWYQLKGKIWKSWGSLFADVGKAPDLIWPEESLSPAVLAARRGPFHCSSLADSVPDWLYPEPFPLPVFIRSVVTESQGLNMKIVNREPGPGETETPHSMGRALCPQETGIQRGFFVLFYHLQSCHKITPK